MPPPSPRYRWLVHAYCLLGNHYHLLVETPRPTLSRGMRNTNGVYAQWFNRRHGKVGHLFQSRYGAVLVEREPHALALAAYIVQNPIRAGLVDRPADWPWSSYRATAGLCDPPTFLTTDFLLGQLSPDLAEARRRFRDLVAATDHPPDEPRGGLYLGSESFARELAPGRPVGETPRRHWAPVPPPLARLLRDPTDAALAHAYRHGYTLAAIAAEIGKHYTTVSRRIRAYEHGSTDGEMR